MRQAFLPVGGNQLRLVVQRVNIVGQCQGDNIGFESVNYRAGLFARAAVGLIDSDGVAGLGFPLFGEGGVEFLIQLARRVVRNIEQRDICCTGCGDGEQGDAEQAGNR